jgi:hypothetical protein
MALLFYLKYIFGITGESKKKSYNYYCFSLLFFILSLFSKGQAVTLPLILVAIDYFYKRKLLNRKVIFEKVPFFVLSLIFGIVAIQSQSELNPKILEYPLTHRIVFLSFSFVQYLFKLIIPINLSGRYPYPVDVGADLPVLYWIYPVIACLTMFAVFVLLRRNKLWVFPISLYLFN